MHCTWGECAHQAPGCLSCSDQGSHKTKAQLSLCLCGVPQNLNLSSLGLGSAPNSGPTPCRAAWSRSSVDGESTHSTSGGKPSVAGTLRVLPTHATEMCLQCPSLPTARVNKCTFTESQGLEKNISCKWRPKENRSCNTHIR